jgi:hypothetical protein
MSNPDREAARKLLETGALVEFEVTQKEIQPTVDGEDAGVRLELQLGGPEGGEGEEQVEWGALGFLYALAVLSFHDARPRGASGMDFAVEDEFGLGEFLQSLRFTHGELQLETDYVRGRCMKTSATVRRDGRVSLCTWNRGEAAVRWVDRLLGKKLLEVVR